MILDPRLPLRLQILFIPEPNSGCRLFVGTWETGNGYGKTYWLGRHAVIHRVVYKLLVDPLLPDELLLDHKCRVRWCSNPEHLEPVTGKVNTARGNAILFKKAEQYEPQA